MADKQAKIDAALSALTSADGAGSQDGADAHLRVDAYGALHTTPSVGGVAVPLVPLEYTILASAARTTLQSVTVTNTAGYRGAYIIIDVTVDPALASVTPTIEGVSSLGSDDFVLLTGSAIAAVGVTVLRVYPGATAAANTVANATLPPIWKFKIAVADADSLTYSVNAILLP